MLLYITYVTIFIMICTYIYNMYTHIKCACTYIYLYKFIYTNIYLFTFTYPIAFRCRRGAVDFVTNCVHPSLFSAALIALFISIPVHFSILSCHCIFGLPRLLLPSIEP